MLQLQVSFPNNVMHRHIESYYKENFMKHLKNLSKID